jgi:hypothetical protein
MAALQAQLTASGDGNASATLVVGNLTCTVEIDLIEGNATAVAFDVVLKVITADVAAADKAHTLLPFRQPPGVSHGLHLIVCGVVACSQQEQQQQQQQQEPVKCLFNSASYVASRVSVSLALDPSLVLYPAPLRPLAASLAESQREAAGYVFLPMAAAANGSSFPPHMLRVSNLIVYPPIASCM